MGVLWQQSTFLLWSIACCWGFCYICKQFDCRSPASSSCSLNFTCVAVLGRWERMEHFIETALFGGRGCSQSKAQRDGNHTAAPPLPLKSTGSWPLGTACCYLPPGYFRGEILTSLSFFSTLTNTMCGGDASASILVESFNSPSFLQCLFFLPTEKGVPYSQR